MKVKLKLELSTCTQLMMELPTVQALSETATTRMHFINYNQFLVDLKKCIDRMSSTTATKKYTCTFCSNGVLAASKHLNKMGGFYTVFELYFLNEMRAQLNDQCVHILNHQ